VATGISKDLIQRAADVTLKERRPLVFVPRETPVRAGTLRQMADLAAEGAVILPASPGFYAGAKDVCELVDFIAAKVLDVIGVPHTLSRRWAGQLGVATDSPHD
jgi:4-hydroxy-3-polyprenylbenzoate decarboxylase